MFLSFIIVSQGNQSQLTTTLESLKEQTFQEFEIIIIDDTGYQQNSSNLEFFHNLLSNNKYSSNIRVVSNLKGQGVSYNWNLGKKYCKGQFFMFIKEGESFVTSTSSNEIYQAINEQSRIPSIVEFKMQYNNLDNSVTHLRIAKNKILNPQESKEIIAKVHNSVYSKIFNTSFVEMQKINFRKYVRYDLLFLYKLLAKCEGFLAVDIVLINFKLSKLKYSSLDLIKQWSHILNHYRYLDIYKKFQDELEYAYIRYILYTFLKVISRFDNKKLMNKGVMIAQKKADMKMKKLKNNKYFTSNDDDAFNKISENINEYLKEWKTKYIGKWS